MLKLKVGNVRIHAERVIGLMKKAFAILQGTLQRTFIKPLKKKFLKNYLIKVNLKLFVLP